MTRCRTVVVITHTARLGGAELALLRLCNALGEGFPRVRVVCFEEGDLVQRLRAMGVGVNVLKPAGSWVTADRRSTSSGLRGACQMAVGSAHHALLLAGLIRQLQPDVVSSWTLKAHLVATVSRLLYRRPLVWFLHDRVSADYLGTLNSMVVRALSRSATAVVANSDATGRTLGRRYAVAYPGLAPDQFRLSGDRTPASPPELLLLGRISPTKGQLEAIQAMALVREVFPGVKLRIVGTPIFGEEQYAAECRALAHRLGLGEVVEFAGHSADPAKDLDRATALVHASPTPEPFGQVVAEAMARRVPVVATDAGGVPELLRDGSLSYGRLVPPGDPSALSEAVVEVLSRPTETQTRADRAFRRARGSFTIQETAQIVSGIWNEAVAPGPRVPVPWLKPGVPAVDVPPASIGGWRRRRDRGSAG